MNNPTPKMPSSKKLASLAGIIVLVFAVAFGGGWFGSWMYTNHNPGGTTADAKQRYISTEGELISQIAKDVGAGVVSVDVTSQVSGVDFFGFGTSANQESAGTGFIISKEGVIVTNRHVVPDGTTSAKVTLSNGKKFDVDVLGRTSASSTLDVAFLKIKNLGDYKLSPVTLGDSSKMQVGYKVVAIGNALGQFQNTVTSGIISGYGRDLDASDGSGGGESLNDLFQTDAAINEGNSGGPLVNMSGEVIGINTAVAGGAQNIGFAIPINDVKGLIEGVLSTGKLQQPYLGVRYISLTDDYAYQYNLDTKRGAYIAPSAGGQVSILDGSPAAKAGLKEKDIITKVDNQTIDDKTSLTSVLAQHKVGDTVKLTVVRGDKTITLTATLEASPST
jgi:serine protease Do